MPEGALCAALALPLDKEGADVGRISLVVGGRPLHLHQRVTWLRLQQAEPPSVPQLHDTRIRKTLEAMVSRAFLTRAALALICRLPPLETAILE